MSPSPADELASEADVEKYVCGLVPNDRVFFGEKTAEDGQEYFIDNAFVEISETKRLPKELKVVANIERFPHALDFKEGNYISMNDLNKMMEPEDPNSETGVHGNVPMASAKPPVAV